MADNIAITAGAGTTIATDDVGGFHHQRVKLVWGVDGVVTDTSTTNPLPIKIDSTQLGSLGAATTANSVSVVLANDLSKYETVAASQTDQILGATGAVGDYLESLICVVATAATSQVQIKDGNGSAITILPNAVGAGVGTYTIPVGLISINATTPGWKVTTAAGVSVIGTGRFT